MRNAIRTAVAMAAAVMALIAPMASPAGAKPSWTAGSGPNGWRAGPITWNPCPQHSDDPGLRCATLDLPIDWAHPHGPTFSLAIAKQVATDPKRRIGPLLVGTGGPGLSGVDYVFDADTKFSPEIRRRFDIIGFDPRGVARSSPAVCSVSLLAQMPYPVISSQADYDQQIAYNKRLYDDCRARTGPLFDHADTLSVAYDMDAIRAALGAQRISYHGVSYGTLIGQVYAERFPGRVRALALDSVMDHSLSTKPFLVDQAAAVEDSFDEFAAWCDRSPACALHGRSVGALYDDLMRRAETGTLVDPTSGNRLTWFDLSKHAFKEFYGPNWSSLANWLDSLDNTTLGATSPKAAAPSTGEVAELPLPVVCGDWSLPIDGYAQMSRYLDKSRAVAPHLRVSTGALAPTMVCLGWQGTVNNPQHRLRVNTSTPLLLINAQHDPATPYAWARNVADQLGDNGRLVTYQGWGHGAYLRTACTTGYVDRFLIDRKLPPIGATCRATAQTK
ncbi:alpha/beta hydrolase fold [Asanoa ishikariensis]|uniref:Alpha/beta hydrolase fold n=1 Tax=Asanoa ishikariensis TaxID=137265 RepID=A0A1H3UMP0_9ACTN|nr:alpha/beta hydrolase [Asanoa ishikariensis]SDZ63617.1 alpha/beta hydrolase fold [Asanoa ishikariensis]